MNGANTGLTNQGTILIKRQVVRYLPKNNETDHLSKKDLLKASISDQYIRQQAKKEAVNQYNNSPKRTLENAAIFLGIPAFYSLADGALNSLKITDKIKTTLKTAKHLGVGIAAILGTFKAADALTNNVPAMKEFKKDHPTATLLGTIVGAVGAARVANPLFKKLSKKIAAVTIKGNNIGAKISAETKAAVTKLGLNSPKFFNSVDNKVFKPVEKALQKNPGKTIFKYGTPLVIAGVIVNHFANMAGIKKNYKNIKQELEQERLVNRAKFVLSQPQPQIIKETKQIILMPEEKQA